MKKILISLFFLFNASNALALPETSQKESDQEFVQGSEDIPLLKGMKLILEDDAVGFDSQSGSITSSSYKTQNSLEEVKNFYVATLPQLGWKAVNKNNKSLKFSREKERLEIEFELKKKQKIVKFFISSSTKK